MIRKMKTKTKKGTEFSDKIMAHYIPQPAYYDSMPVDISFVFESEKPAGKHGFLRCDGDDLRFEDGTLARFWGVNVNGGACFPEHNYSEKFAERLAQTGCNIVRFHQMDAQFDTPNIFGYTKGKRVETTRKFDKRSLDALDYLIYCLKQKGIYVYLDLLTYRHYKAADGVMQAENLPDAGKPWGNMDPKMIELQKEYAFMLWTHHNPYTNLDYKDEPAIALTELLNECDLFGGGGRYGESVSEYEKEFRSLFRDWLKENNIEYDWQNCELKGNNPTLVKFKVYLTKKYYGEMRKYLRSIGVKIPITGTNWSNMSALAYCNSMLDFTDSHTYFYDWQWGHSVRKCENKSITSVKSVFPQLAMMKVAKKPFFVSEWDMPWPNEYRAEGPIYFASVGALQGWSGFAIHTYSYGTRLNEMKILGREQSSPVGGIPYREGIFSTWNDPAKYGLFYHCALITRRQDIKPTKDRTAIKVKALESSDCTALENILEQKTAACIFDDELPDGYKEKVNIDEKYPAKDGLFEASDGQMWRDLEKKIGCVDTDRTKIAYGFLSNADSIDFGKNKDEMHISSKSDFGVIALSSLTDDAITQSDNILLTAIGRAKNTDSVFDGDVMVDIGKPPILAQVIEADISIKVSEGKTFEVWGVNAEGYYCGEVKSDVENGYLSFHLGNIENSACYYLIVAD